MSRGKNVQQFGAKLMAALLKAAEGPFRIKCGPRNKAVTLRARLYSLRKAMERERHLSYPVVAKVNFSLHEEGGEWFVIAGQVDTSFDEILDAAGVDMPAAPEV